MARGKNLSKAGLGGGGISRPLFMDGEGEKNFGVRLKPRCLDIWIVGMQYVHGVYRPELWRELGKEWPF